jgi:branched-chain amino acid transport system ATP-binding protein
MLSVEHLDCYYGKVRALEDVSLSVPEGTLVKLLGSNGAGKSTCLKAISRIVKTRAGSITLDGTNLTSLDAAEVVRLGVVQVPEGRMIFPQLTVQENLAMGAFTRSDKKGIHEDYDRMYSYFPILKERRTQVSSTLSGGEQQMLAIARGLMGRPTVLLLDEPSLGLAPVLVEEIFEFLKAEKARGTTILLVEQNAFAALGIADTAYVLETGKITLSGPAAELKSNPKVQESYLGVGALADR